MSWVTGRPQSSLTSCVRSSREQLLVHVQEKLLYEVVEICKHKSRHKHAYIKTHFAAPILYWDNYKTHVRVVNMWQIHVYILLSNQTHDIDDADNLHEYIILYSSELYNIMIAHVSNIVMFYRFIEILDKHRPRAVWNPTVKEHEFYYQ